MSRWCRVVSDRFDFLLGPTRMMSKLKGEVLFLPRNILEFGVNSGSLEKIPRPPGFRVDKSGKVVPCSQS